MRLEVVDDLVEQVAGAVAVQPGDRDRVAEPEAVQVERERVLRGSSILFASTSTGFFDSRRIWATSSSPGRDPDLRVDDEEDEVRLGDGLARLLGDRARERRRVGDVDAAGVDQQEPPAAPFETSSLRSRVTPEVSWTTACARPAQPVDERRLADVREADDRDGAEQSVATLGRRVRVCVSRLRAAVVPVARAAVTQL